MKKYWILLLAGAVMLALSVSCDKGEAPPKPEPPEPPEPPTEIEDSIGVWTPKSPLELDDSLFYYYGDDQKEYFTRRKDRVVIKADSYENAQALSGLLRPSLYWGEWVFAAIDSTAMDLSDVLALPGALDATYGLEVEYVNGMVHYTMNDIFLQPKAGFTPEQILRKVGLSEYVSSIELDSEYSNIYYLSFNLSIGETLRICRELYETGQCGFASPNFYHVREGNPR